MKDFNIKLFYSYCHEDEEHKKNMEEALSLLRTRKILSEFSDREILAGQNVSKQIMKELERSDIIVFLVSQSFLNSKACLEEWELAKGLAENGSKTLVSVIVRDCSWKDFDNMSEYLALPTDGKPITRWDNEDTAWRVVYEGIRDVINHIQKTFVLKQDFKKGLSVLEFCSQSQEEILLDDLFVFPQCKRSF